MPLSIGDRFGPYEILAPLGAGGMGEVYRARDGKLKREVALKILPANFAGDPDRMSRFHREAELLASLNHPNIATIYGFEDNALAMELIAGETLRDIAGKAHRHLAIFPGGQRRLRRTDRKHDQAILVKRHPRPRCDHAPIVRDLGDDIVVRQRLT
jgi:serine/threonine protein kinase